MKDKIAIKKQPSRPSRSKNEKPAPERKRMIEDGSFATEYQKEKKKKEVLKRGKHYSATCTDEIVGRKRKKETRKSHLG